MAASQTYLVGGAVRDQLLGLAMHERDYVVVGSTPEALLALGYTQVGRDFPVFLHPKSKEEYALARTERKAGQGYKGFAVHATPQVTLEDDLLRRDLTINAIAQTSEGQLIDPYGGQEDIQAKLLRHVSEAFSEDPLRVLRTARFAAHLHHLGFSIAAKTKALLATITRSGELATLAKERVWQETHKALSSQSPWVYFEVLEACGALHELMPALADLLNRRPQALNTLKLLSEFNTNTDVRLCALLYQLNKLQIERYNQQLGAKQNYFGYRDAINYLGEYNLSLDEKIIYGVDAEFDASRYNRSSLATNVKHDEGIISQYFDYQFRPMEKLHATVGARRDDHTTVGAKESGRITAAYLLNGNSKIRSSIGTGIRFPALYDYAYGYSTAVTLGQSLEELQAEQI